MKDWRSDKKGAALLASPAKSFASTVLDKLWKRVTRGGNLVDLDDETRQGGNQTPQAIYQGDGRDFRINSVA